MQVLLDQGDRKPPHLQISDSDSDSATQATRTSLSLVRHFLLLLSGVYIVAGVFIFALVTCQDVMTDVLNMELKHVHDYHVSVCD